LLTPSCLPLPLPLSLSSTPSTTSPFVPPSPSSSSFPHSLSHPITSSSILSYLSPNSMDNISIKKERDKEKSVTEKRTKIKEKSIKIKEKEMENDAIAFPFSSVSLSECRSEESASRKAFRAGEGAHPYHSIRKSIHKNACDNMSEFENEVEEKNEEEREDDEEEKGEGEGGEEREGDDCLLIDELIINQNDNNNEKDGERENDENENDGDDDETGILTDEIHFQRQLSATTSCDEEKDEDNQLDYNNQNNFENRKNDQNSQNSGKIRILNNGNLNELLGAKVILNKFNLSESGNSISRKNLIYGNFDSNEYSDNVIYGKNKIDNYYYLKNKSGERNEIENKYDYGSDDVNHINNEIKNSNFNDKCSCDISLLVQEEKCNAQEIGEKETNAMVNLKIDLRDEKVTYVRTDEERVGGSQIDFNNNNFYFYNNDNNDNQLNYENCDGNESNNNIDLPNNNVNNDDNHSNNDYDNSNKNNNNNIIINNNDNNDKKFNFNSNLNSCDESTPKIKNDYDYRIENKNEIISNENIYNNDCEILKNNNSSSNKNFHNDKNSNYNDDNNKTINSERSFYCKGQLNSDNKILNLTLSNLIESEVEKDVVFEKEVEEKGSVFCDSEVGNDSSGEKIKIDLKSFEKAIGNENENVVLRTEKGGNENDLNFIHENVTRKNENVDNKFENNDRNNNNDSHNNDYTSNNNYNNISNTDCEVGVEHNITMMKYKKGENFIKIEKTEKIVDDSQNWQNSRDFIPKQKSVKSHKSEITEFNNPNLGIKSNIAQEEYLRLLNFSLSKAEKIFLGGSEKGSDSWRETRNRSGKNNNNNSSFMSSGYVLQKNLKIENRKEVENNENKSMKAKIRNLVKIGEKEGGIMYNTISKNEYSSSNNNEFSSKLSEFEIEKTIQNLNRSDQNTETMRNETSDDNGNENRDFEIDNKNTDFIDVNKTINLQSISNNDEIKASNKIRSGRSYEKERVIVSDRNPEWPTKSTKVYESG
jgi:hypothetical protein